MSSDLQKFLSAVTKHDFKIDFKVEEQAVAPQPVVAPQPAPEPVVEVQPEPVVTREIEPEQSEIVSEEVIDTKKSKK